MSTLVMLSYAVLLHSLPASLVMPLLAKEGITSTPLYTHVAGRLRSCTGLSLRGPVTRLEYAMGRLVMQGEPCRA